MMKLKTITETSWLVVDDVETDRVGLLTEIRDRYTLMIKGEKKQFLNRKEISDYFKQDIFTNIIEQKVVVEKTECFVKGFPVDYENPHEVVLRGVDLPLYSKKLTSDIYYSAGYYCLNFPKNWMPAYCPKLSTLQSYEYAGPFLSEVEMRNQLSKLRKSNTKKNGSQ